MSDRPLPRRAPRTRPTTGGPGFSRRAIGALIALGAMLVVAGCASQAPATTPSSTGPTIVTMAHVDNDLELDPAAQSFIDRVGELSDGAMEVKLVGECCGRQDDAASRLVTGVAHGDYALGWVMTRGLEDVGVTSFEALSAPRLIDSYAAEAAVLKSGLGAKMLPGLAALKVQGIALEPGTLRRPIASKSPLLAPADWKNIVFWSNKSKLADATFQALGAASTQVGNDDRDAGLSSGAIRGAENSVAWQSTTQHVPDPVISLNEAIWPRISVLLANPASLSKLTSTQRAWIRKAAQDVSATTPDIARFDAKAVSPLCADGQPHFAVADAQQLAETDAALAPVYAQLASDSATASMITKIRALKPDPSPTEYQVPATCLVPSP